MRSPVSRMDAEAFVVAAAGPKAHAAHNIDTHLRITVRLRVGSVPHNIIFETPIADADDRRGSSMKILFHPF